jgi:hypothetical protein
MPPIVREEARKAIKLAALARIQKAVDKGEYIALIKLSENPNLSEDVRKKAEENIVPAVQNATEKYASRGWYSQIPSLLRDGSLPQEARKAVEERMRDLAILLAKEMRIANPIAGDGEMLNSRIKQPSQQGKIPQNPNNAKKATI